MQCSAHSVRTGDPCQKQAMEGLTVCRSHGGATPAAREKSLRAKEEAKIQRKAANLTAALIGDTPPSHIDPVVELLSVVQIAAANERVLAMMVEDEGLQPGSVHKDTTYNMWERAIDRRATYAEKAIKVGIAERQVRIAEDVGTQVGQVLMAVLEKLNLPTTVREQARVLLGEQLRLTAPR